MPFSGPRRVVPKPKRTIHGKTAPHGRHDRLAMRIGSWKRARALVPAPQRLARVSKPRRKGPAGPVKETVTLKYGGRINPQEAARQEKFAEAARERELLKMGANEFHELVREKLEYLRRVRADPRTEVYWYRLGSLEERIKQGSVSAAIRQAAIKQIIYAERFAAMHESLQ